MAVALGQLLVEDEELAGGYTVLQQFRGQVAERTVASRDGWLSEAGSGRQRRS